MVSGVPEKRTIVMGVSWYNQYMTKKEIGILIVLSIFVVGLIVFGVMTQNERERMLKDFEKLESEKPVGEVTLPPEGSNFVSDVPNNVVETAPNAQAPAAPGSSAKLGLYEIEISKNGFVPEQLVVKKGDVVGLKITATDAKYDFIIPYLELGMVIQRGETKQGSFRADTTGIFSFECKDFCPPQGIVRGAIVVKE